MSGSSTKGQRTGGTGPPRRKPRAGPGLKRLALSLLGLWLGIQAQACICAVVQASERCTQTGAAFESGDKIVSEHSASHRSSSFFSASHKLRAGNASDAPLGRQPKPAEQLALERLLRESRDEAELPELSSFFNPNDPLQLRAVDNFFYHNERLHEKFSVADYGLMALVARAQAMVYGDLYIHSYDNHADLRRSFGPDVDNELCLRQLEYLVERTILQEREKYYSKDLNLFRLLDTWGHSSAGLLLGNVFFEGMYQECLRMSIRMRPGEPRAPTRYCVLTLKHPDWPKIDRHDLLSLKGGICIPRSCDSANYKHKYALIMRMVEYQLRRPEEGQVKLNQMYCLPDEDSPLRSIAHHPQSLATLAGLSGWLLLLAWATYKYHKLAASNSHQEQRRPDEPTASQAGRGFGLTNVLAGRPNPAASCQGTLPAGARAVPQRAGGSAHARRLSIYRTLSIANNLRLLVDTTKESALMDASRRLREGEAEGGAAAGPASQAAGDKLVDLRCIEGIKVIAMCYVIMGHVLMCMSSLLANGKEFVADGGLAFFLANLVPAFAVNSFFTITGLLTSYLMFKQNQTYPFITSPAKWLAFIAYRYLRIMPMYALLVLYCKSLAKFAGHGPLWDYGTSSLAQRRTCELESWRWTLSFTSNFLPPLQHCIPGGWYLSNDFQFFLVTPIFLAALYKRPRLGQLLLYVCIAAGYLAGLYGIASSQVDDLRPIANFAPHGFKTYVSHFSANYTNPQYRIPAYLIGLLVGFRLYLFEVAKQEHRRCKRAAVAAAAAAESSPGCQVHERDQSQPEREPDWSEGFKRLGTPTCVLLVALCCITPAIGAQLPFTKRSARIMVALITPSYHVLFALAVGLYLLLATTGHGSRRLNDLMAAPHWKPLARLSLCAVLVNVEVINFIVQGSAVQQFVSPKFHIALNCLCILATYLVAALVCVLFEAPIRGALNALLTYAITRLAAKAADGRRRQRRPGRKSSATGQPPGESAEALQADACGAGCKKTD